MEKGTLVLVRHGESRLNKLNVFTGWLDVALSELGIQEAHKAGEHCKNYNYDVVFTSHLERAHETLLIILSSQKKIGVFFHDSDSKYEVNKNISTDFTKNILPIHTTRLLNERSYGDLQGLDKEKMTEKFGEEQIFKWRRGFYDQPPGGESLKQVYDRATSYFNENIISHLKEGKQVLISAHGNSLRAIIKLLEDISDENIANIDLPFGHPLVYEYNNEQFKLVDGAYTYSRPLR